MSTKTIVLVFPQDTGTHVEVNDFDHAQDAERFIEGLLAVGFERHSIRVLAAHDLDFQIIQKPVVSLLPADWASQLDLEDAPAPVEVVAALDSRMESDLVPVGAGESSEPYTRDGIRFSSAFGSESLGQRGDRARRRYGPGL